MDVRKFDVSSESEIYHGDVLVLKPEARRLVLRFGAFIALGDPMKGVTGSVVTIFSGTIVASPILVDLSPEFILQLPIAGTDDNGTTNVFFCFVDGTTMLRLRRDLVSL